jgi:Domain of unknown function (DUF4331)
MRFPALRGRPLPRAVTRVVAPIAAAVVVTAVVAGVVVASDHQDTPLVELNQRFDVNDVYAFPASTPDRTVLVLGTSSPLTPAGTPTARFGDVSEVLYQLKVDNDGDGVENLVFQITFSNGGDGQQRVTMIGPVRPAKTGPQSMRVLDQPSRTITGLTNQTLGTPTGTQLFAGPRDDPFFIDLEQFFRVLPDRRPQGGPLSQTAQGPLTFRAPGQAVDFVRGLNDLAIVIELPAALLTDNGQHPRFGVWGTTSLRRTASTL